MEGRLDETIEVEVVASSVTALAKPLVLECRSCSVVAGELVIDADVEIANAVEVGLDGTPLETSSTFWDVDALTIEVETTVVMDVGVEVVS